MSFDLLEQLQQLPDVPVEIRDESGYRDLYVANHVPNDLVALLRDKGWRVRDIRLLDSGEYVRAVLNGIATNTIDPAVIDIKQLELMAKIHGLLGKDAKVEIKEDLGQMTVDLLLDGFATDKLVEQEAPTKKRGRPPGAKNKVSPLVKQIVEIIEEKKETVE